MDATNVTSPQILTVVKAHAGNFTQGQTGANYSIAVTNSGTGATGGTVAVTDALPAGLTAAAIGGTGWTCTLTTLTCTRSDALGAGMSYPALSVTVDVAGNAPASVTNTAAVWGGGAATANSTDVARIGQLPQLTVTSRHVGNFAAGQTAATYLINVNNVGRGPTNTATDQTKILQQSGATIAGHRGTDA